MSPQDKMLTMKWKGYIPLSQISEEYEKNILKLINSKPLSNVWFGWQGFAWLEAFNYKRSIKEYNKSVKFISRKVLHKRIHDYETELACDKLLQGICKAFELV